MTVKLFIDAGHGGTDPGAGGYGLREKDLTLTISKRIDAILRDYDGVTVKLSRTGDESLSLSQRTAAANKWGADYLLSVHINATPAGHGFESFTYNGAIQSNTQALRSTIHDEIMKALGTGVRDRGKKRANFHMVRESKMPAMLTESLFIDNPGDNAKLKDTKFIEKVAQGHANGLIKAFKLAKKVAAKPAPTVNKNTFYRVVAGSYNDRKNADAQVAKLKKLGVEGVFIDVFQK